MLKTLFHLINFHLFEGGDGAGTGSEGAGQGQESLTQGENTQTVQAAAGQADSDAENTENKLEDRRKTWKNLIKGEYKDLYTEETQRMIDRRFAETKALKAQTDSYQPIIDAMFSKYGIKDGDVTKLQAAIDNDNSMWEDAAYEAGMSVDAYKAFQKAVAENNRFRAEQQRSQEEQRLRQQAQTWYDESEALKAKFPKFNFKAEFENPQFQAMLKAGTPIEHAYKVIHFDELMSDAISNTAVKTEKQIADNIRAKGSRPSENGSSSRSAFTTNGNQQRNELSYYEKLIERARRGEKVRP